MKKIQCRFISGSSAFQLILDGYQNESRILGMNILDSGVDVEIWILRSGMKEYVILSPGVIATKLFLEMTNVDIPILDEKLKFPSMSSGSIGSSLHIDTDEIIIF